MRAVRGQGAGTPLARRLPCTPRIMLCRHGAVLALVVVMLLPPSVASPAGDDERPRNIRTTDRRVRALIAAGVRVSLTFRALVQHVERSDVVVYVMCEGEPDGGIAGRLTFVSAAGGWRYVVIRLARLPRQQQIAILGHELQHAAEIADDPSIVDGPSLARAYRRIGHINRASPGVAFDTEAAIAAGRQVLGELSGSGD